MTWSQKIFHKKPFRSFRVIFRYEIKHDQACGFSCIAFLDCNKANFFFINTFHVALWYRVSIASATDAALRKLYLFNSLWLFVTVKVKFLAGVPKWKKNRVIWHSHAHFRWRVTKLTILIWCHLWDPQILVPFLRNCLISGVHTHHQGLTLTRANLSFAWVFQKWCVMQPLLLATFEGRIFYITYKFFRCSLLKRHLK